MTKQKLIEYLSEHLTYEDIKIADAEAKAYAEGFKEGLESRKRGEWIRFGDTGVQCSECGDNWFCIEQYLNFCPNCGAKMNK